MLQGPFAVTIASEDVPPALINGASLIGRWHVTFNADGTYLLGRQDVGLLVTGQFETDGDQVTLRAETGVLACASGEEEDGAATYSWEIAENRLLLIAIEEPCAKRRLLLTTRTLARFEACPPAARARTTFAGAAAAIGTPSPSPPDGAIDTLLRQMSDCWATRDPDRFLPLLSKEAAWSFIEFAIGPVGQAVLATTGRTVPSLRSVAESDAFLRGTSLPLQFGGEPLGLLPKRSRVFLDNVPFSRRLPAMATLPVVEGMFDRAFKQAFYVDADIPKATATIALDIQGVLGDRLTMPSFLFREGMSEIEE